MEKKIFLKKLLVKTAYAETVPVGFLIFLIKKKSFQKNLTVQKIGKILRIRFLRKG